MRYCEDTCREVVRDVKNETKLVDVLGKILIRNLPSAK